MVYFNMSLNWYQILQCWLCAGKGYIETQKESFELRAYEYLNGDKCPLCDGRGELQIYRKD